MMKVRVLIAAFIFGTLLTTANAVLLEDDFVNPPDSARPGVYWYFMDGNLDQQEMINDLDSMKEAGLVVLKQTGNMVQLYSFFKKHLLILHHFLITRRPPGS